MSEEHTPPAAGATPPKAAPPSPPVDTPSTGRVGRGPAAPATPAQHNPKAPAPGGRVRAAKAPRGELAQGVNTHRPRVMRTIEREVARHLITLLPRIAGARDRKLVLWLRDDGIAESADPNFTDATSAELRRLVHRYAEHFPLELRERAQLELGR